MEEPASSHQLLEHILSPGNIGEAWKRVRANKGAPGIDSITVDAFPDAFRKQWAEICSIILAGAYKPSLYFALKYQSRMEVSGRLVFQSCWIG
jgi:RNA-directed DNA polymerase